jgi:hypothetical protein
MGEPAERTGNSTSGGKPWRPPRWPAALLVVLVAIAVALLALMTR